ncbi:Sec63-domain-containing protein [Trametes versicolor FP-101664 SS1]|uniref:Sec63-domain-containing protein n=1 Tax=Trametes versicolor (strain FP-101664) TaxID=717944 RepID=UPI000462150D|nr:Sec63-domain-containing protein [Trametes versicolor FP-101664 SS1]EIW61251.1 Sec63-domain-containing protein [Trametes versicolor FP-101664 SS1]
MAPDLAGHLEYLVGTAEESADREKRLLDEWSRYSVPGNNGVPPKDVSSDLGEDDEWDSILDFLQDASNAPDGQSDDSIISSLLSKPDVEHLLPSLVSLLSSNKPDDAISEELVEMIGFDNIELSMQLLVNRKHAVRELNTFLSGGSSQPPPPPAREQHNGRSKGKQKQAPSSQLDSLDPAEARRRMEETLRANADRPLYTGTAHDAPEALTHVYTSSAMAQGNVLSHLGTRYMLPLGTVRRETEDYEEVTLPPAKTVPPRATERLIPVTELEPLARGSFPGYTSLNRIQSIVYPTAYQSNENMLICAPTGAGKTDVAMLSVLRVLDQFRIRDANPNNLAASIERDKFKVIYVAPMKALASEITRKLGKRLQWLQIRVRELTGDMQLTKKEIAETQIIVTTPEKWDVVTRKPTGEGELASKVKLLIIDEVHLLNDERGAVIETIVARTLRQVESTQSVIRIVGLSATLPNYIDVADFLSVNRHTGLFYFDSSFRPVPLEQHFIGVRGKLNSPQSKKNLDRVTYEKVSELVREGHQVMVFVHARKETVKAAEAIKEAALADGGLEDFSCQEHPQFDFFRRDIGQSRNKEMRQLFDHGFGIHHAGMLRTDRNMMERMFEARAIKVLCCTATLAWGVNLPAHAVIIKGTQVYDSSKGAFTDLSVLDVLQVFGRAGRPGMEDSGVGYICTTEDKLTHYLDAVTSQLPIESKFVAGMIDSLNAEVALGTVANVHDAVQWLGYTYLFVRMRKNPFTYGLAWDEVADDPYLGAKRNQLITSAALQLAEARMLAFDRQTGSLVVTDLGRIAAKYYIRHKSIEIFNEKFRPKMSEADVLSMLSMSTEFDQIQVRENEVKELEAMMENIPCAVKGGTDTSQGKVNILLQAYISQQRPEDFALVSDQAYAAQNGGRIIRALLEIAISRKWANVSAVLMGMSKAIEKRLWPFDNPLKQFELKMDVLYNLERWADDYAVAELAEMSADDLGKLLHLNERHGSAVREAAKQFPTARITYSLRPLGADVLKIAVKIERAFNWSNKTHGSAEPFWVWVEDHDGTNILQLSHLIFRPTTDTLDVDFVISLPSQKRPPSVTIRFVSDRWQGAEEEVEVSLEELVMPAASDSHTPRLDIPFLPLSVVQNPPLQDFLAPRLHGFNAIQSQAFWSVTKTRLNTLLCAPTACGKETLKNSPTASWTLVIAPRRSIALEVTSDLRLSSQGQDATVDFVGADRLFEKPVRKTVRVTTATDLFHAVSRQRNVKEALSRLRLVLCESLELLDAVYELGLSLLLHATQAHPVRFLGLSNSLTDCADLAAWLDVDPLALHSFKPSDRDQALTVSTQTFTIPHSGALFKAMAKPAHAAIQAARGEPAIVFVPSRNQCTSVALDLITQCALEMETARGYLPAEVSLELLEHYLARLQNGALLRDFITRGVGFFHDGIAKPDRLLMLELWAEGLLRVLVAPREACWTLPVRAPTVVVLGTQYVHVAPGGAGDERQVREYALEELVRMQGKAVRHRGAGHFHLFCQAEGKDTITRFLNDGLPLESRLLEAEVLRAWFRERRKDGGIPDKQAAVDVLSCTFLARRLVSNPAYYDARSTSVNELLSRIVDELDG